MTCFAHAAAPQVAVARMAGTGRRLTEGKPCMAEAASDTKRAAEEPKQGPHSGLIATTGLNAYSCVPRNPGNIQWKAAPTHATVPQDRVSRCDCCGSSSLLSPRSAILQVKPLLPSSRLLKSTFAVQSAERAGHLHPVKLCVTRYQQGMVEAALSEHTASHHCGLPTRC